MTAEEFILVCTRNCSNESGGWNNGEYSRLFTPWVTPDQALKAVEMAKEEARQQLMKRVESAGVTDIRYYKDETEVDFTVMYEKGVIPYETEDQVKLIIIKED